MEPGAVVRLDRLAVEEGATITFDRVLMVGGEDIKIGTPTVAGAKVSAEVVSHLLGDKVSGMKFRRRRRMRRRFGSRHAHTDVKIIGIDLG
jgi:large subunit ribosomal protein L21